MQHTIGGNLFHITAMCVAMELRKNKIEKRGKFFSLVAKSSVQKFKATILSLQVYHFCP